MSMQIKALLRILYLVILTWASVSTANSCRTVVTENTRENIEQTKTLGLDRAQVQARSYQEIRGFLSAEAQSAFDQPQNFSELDVLFTILENAMNSSKVEGAINLGSRHTPAYLTPKAVKKFSEYMLLLIDFKNKKDALALATHLVGWIDSADAALFVYQNLHQLTPKAFDVVFKKLLQDCRYFKCKKTEEFFASSSNIFI